MHVRQRWLSVAKRQTTSLDLPSLLHDLTTARAVQRGRAREDATRVVGMVCIAILSAPRRCKRRECGQANATLEGSTPTMYVRANHQGC